MAERKKFLSYTSTHAGTYFWRTYTVPRSIKEKSIYLTPVIGAFKKIIWQEDVTKGLASEEARLVHEGYNSGIPVNQSWHLFTLIKKGMKALPHVRAEVLLMQSGNDRVIPADSMDYIYNSIASETKKKVLLQTSNHAITVDLEKENVAEQVIAFLGRK